MESFEVKLVQGIRLKRKKMQQDHEDEFAKEMMNATNYVLPFLVSLSFRPIYHYWL